MAETRLSLFVLDHQIILPAEGRIAVLRARPDGDYTPFDPSRLTLANSFRPSFDRLVGMASEVVQQAEGRFALTLVEITRSKLETLGLVAHAMQVTLPGGLVLVDGAKTDGIESILKHCRAAFDLAGVISKSHGKLFWIKRPDVLPPELADWAAAAAPHRNAAGFVTAAGMFSPEKVDAGSMMLAQHFDHTLGGKVADLGAGWGWLAAQALARGSIDEIDLFEAEALALDAARQNLPDPRARFFWSDVTTLAARPEYDQVIANPPFHQGRAAEPAIGIDFIAKAADILRPKGQFWMVANRQLPYEAALDLCFAQVRVLEETPHFKIFLATRPRVGSARKAKSDRLGSRH